MAKQAISYDPQVLDLTLYAGDGVSFRVLVADATSEPVNLTGTMLAQIRIDRDIEDAALTEFNIDLTDAETGIAVISLTGEQTQALSNGKKFSGVWDLEWTPAGEEPMTLCQGKVECNPDVSR